MLYIGLDFSLTCAALVELDKTNTNNLKYKTYIFVSSEKKLTKKAYEFLELIDAKIIITNPCHSKTSFTFRDDYEAFKCRNSNTSLYKDVLQQIQHSYPNQTIQFNIENYSYNSQNNIQIQIVSQQALIRSYLANAEFSYTAISPASLKSFAQLYHPLPENRPSPHPKKSKNYILQSFLYHKPADYLSSDPKIYHFLEDFSKNKIITSPISDIIDAYYLSLFNFDLYNELKPLPSPVIFSETSEN